MENPSHGPCGPSMRAKERPHPGPDAARAPPLAREIRDNGRTRRHGCIHRRQFVTGIR